MGNGRRSKIGLKSGFVNGATKGFVQNNPKTVVGAGLLTTMGVVGFCHLSYRMSKGVTKNKI